MEMLPLAQKPELAIDRALDVEGASQLVLARQHNFPPHQERMHSHQSDVSNLYELPGCMVPPPKGRRLALERVLQPASLHFVVSISSQGV